MANYLLSVEYDGNPYNDTLNKVVTEYELINFINFMDLRDDIVKYSIYDLAEAHNGKVTPIYYAGWQPGCLIEFKNEAGEVVLRGYGEDH